MAVPIVWQLLGAKKHHYIASRAKNNVTNSKDFSQIWRFVNDTAIQFTHFKKIYYKITFKLLLINFFLV